MTKQSPQDTERKAGKPIPPALKVERIEGQSDGETYARVEVYPMARHGTISHAFAAPTFAGADTSAADLALVLKREGVKVAAGDLAIVSQMLLSQAVSLDTIFTEMARRAAINIGQYPDATERYLRIALKAQANS